MEETLSDIDDKDLEDLFYSEEEVREGFAILDQAFATIAHHYTGSDK